MAKQINTGSIVFKDLSDDKEEGQSFKNLNVVDDGTSHFHFIQNTNWSIWTHHSKDSNPSEVLHSFRRTDFIGYTKHYAEHEMDYHHLRKFQQLFSEDMKKQPWLLTNLHIDSVERVEFYEFAAKLQMWLTRKKYTFLLLNYSCEEHLRMLNVNVNDLKHFLQNSKLELVSERLLLYAAEDGILMNVRFVFDSELEPKTVIDQAVSEGQNDVKLFACLHMNILEDCNITLVTVTVLNNMTRNDVPDNVCTKCSDTLLVTQDEWLKENVLRRRLETIIAQKRKINVEINAPSSSCSPANNFEKVSSRLLGWFDSRFHIVNSRSHTKNI